MNYESLNNNEHLTYEELVEYGQGNLSNSEMHRLEQHLIGCELCNEALEGISLLKQDEDPTVSVEKILKATGSQESTGLGLYYYIGIAASVLLIAVLGFVFLRTDNEPELLTEETSQTHEEQLAESSSSKPEANPTQDTTQSASEETDYLATTELQDVEATPTETQPVITRATPDTTTLIAVQPAAAQGEVSDFELSADISITPADSSLTLEEDSAILTLAEVATEE